MYIKEVIIKGFRSYKEQTSVDGFSPRHNVVVGRNGSGKSNFFFAIQFVLSDEFINLKEEQRLGMLHESTGPRETIARVDIVFDNRDKRIAANDANEVCVSRQIGKKKDQYYIDGKMVPRVDIVNLMESAGFSRSNPYYIVKQGKINELATSPDAHRLKLLREVAGTRVYDERKEESLKILKETREKTEKVESMLKYIEDRLKTLENEKEDLKEYQKWDKTKRSIECTIYDVTIEEAKKELSKLNDQRDELTTRNHKVTSELAQVQTQIARCAAEKRKLDSQFKGMKEEKEVLITEENDLVEKQAELQLKIEDLTEETNKKKRGKSDAENALTVLRSEIEAKQEELETIVPQFETLQEREISLATDVRIGDTRIKELLAKQGSRNQFGSVDERDKYLQKEVKRMRHLIGDTEEHIQAVEQELKTAEQEEENLNTELRLLTQSIEENRSNLDVASNKVTSLKGDYDRAVTAQITATREEKQVRDQITTIESEINQLNDQMRRLTSRPIHNGMIGVQRVIDYFKDNNQNGQHDDVINGYHGPVIDLAYMDPVYFQAVEVIAQNRLFYQVVESDRVASKILRKFNELQLPGEVNFFPLNRVVSKPLRRFDSDRDSRPLLELIDYAANFDAVFRNIFATTILVRELNEKADAVRNNGFDCVTLEGDQMSRRGAMTGGYIDPKRNKLEIHNSKRELIKTQSTLQASLDSAERKVREKTKAMEQVRAEMSSKDDAIRDFHNQHKLLSEKKRSLNDQYGTLVRSKDPMKAQIVQLKNRKRELTAQQDTYQSEIGRDMHSQLSSDESAEIERLRNEVTTKKIELEEVATERRKLETRKGQLENQLKTNLLKKQENLTAKIDDISDNERRHRLQSQQAELGSLLARLVEIRTQMRTLDENLVEYEERSENLARSTEDVQEQQKDLELQLNDFSKQSDAICTKQAALQAQREESLRKSNQLGSRPTEALSKYKNMSQKQLEKKLAECINELKKYENVNKKALDQYMTAFTQKDELTKRLEEQKKCETSIEDLIKVLETRKNDALQLTFQQVTKNFGEVFRRLVPLGQGTLTMTLRDGDDDTVDIVERYKGIAIRVSFTSDASDAETREMQQLSGGQKSLVALALIFAIQMCDPAPFYLFDEIDAALDAQHRHAVTEMIHSLSDNAQFITTTFRPELLASAEKYFGVRFRNKVSHVDVVTKEQAYDFVEDDQTRG